MLLSPAAKGVWYAFLATLIWSGNIIISRLLAGDIPPITLAVIRWVISLIILMVLARSYLPTIGRHIKQSWRYLLLSGFLGIACFNSFIYIAGHTSQAINMSLLTSTSPIFTWLLVWCLGLEPVRIKTIIALIIAALGAVFVVSAGQLSVLRDMVFVSGDFWALAAACSFAAYSISLRYMPPSLPYTLFLVIIVFFGTVMLLPFMAWEWAKGAVMIWHNSYIWLILYLSLGMTVIAYLLWIKATVLIGPGNTSMIYYSLPIMTSLEAIYWLGERIAFYHIIGGACIIGGVLLTVLGKKKA